MAKKNLDYWINELNEILKIDKHPYTQLPEPLNAIRDLAQEGVDVSKALPVLEEVDLQHYHEHGCGVESTIEDIKRLIKKNK